MSTGGQRKRYKDSLKSSLKAFEINNKSWESLAAERGPWRSLIRKGAESYEQTKIRQAKETRLLRKSSAGETGSAIITALPYPNCDRTVRARIGLISHTLTHRLHETDQWCHGHHPRRLDEQERERCQVEGSNGLLRVFRRTNLCRTIARPAPGCQLWFLRTTTRVQHYPFDRCVLLSRPCAKIGYRQ